MLGQARGSPEPPFRVWTHFSASSRQDILCMVTTLKLYTKNQKRFLISFVITGMDNFNKAGYLGSWFEYTNVFEFYQIGKGRRKKKHT